MLYPQNGDRIEAIDCVTSLHPIYIILTYRIIFALVDVCMCMSDYFQLMTSADGDRTVITRGNPFKLSVN